MTAAIVANWLTPGTWVDPPPEPQPPPHATYRNNTAAPVLLTFCVGPTHFPGGVHALDPGHLFNTVEVGASGGLLTVDPAELNGSHVTYRAGLAGLTEV